MKKKLEAFGGGLIYISVTELFMAYFKIEPSIPAGWCCLGLALVIILSTIFFEDDE